MTKKKGRPSEAETSAPARRKLLIDQDKEKVVNSALKKFRQKVLAQEEAQPVRTRTRSTTTSYITEQMDLSAMRTYSNTYTIPTFRGRTVSVDPGPPPTEDLRRTSLQNMYIDENVAQPDSPVPAILSPGIVVTGQHQNGAASYEGITPVPLGPEHGFYYTPEEIQANNARLQAGQALRYQQELDNHLHDALVYGSSVMRVTDSHAEHIRLHQLLANPQLGAADLSPPVAEEPTGSGGIPTYIPRQIPNSEQNIRIPTINYQQFPTDTAQLGNAADSFFNSTNYTSMVSYRTLTRREYEREEYLMHVLSVWFPWVSETTLRHTAIELQVRDIHSIASPPPTWNRSRSAHDELHQYAMTSLRYHNELDIYQVAIGVYKDNEMCGILKAVNLSRWMNRLDANVPQDEQLEVTWNQ